MARKPRIEYEGAVYHIMSRGDHGEAIYVDDEDRNRFVESLGELCKRTGWLIHAYVLMSNHYHLLVETPEANLVVGMKWLQGTYTMRFNIRHHQRGHLFQGRYKALVVDSEDDTGYFLKLSSYIHLNPLRAGLVDMESVGLEKYRWSSYPLYIKGPSQRPGYLKVSGVLGDLHVDDDYRGRGVYRKYVNRLAKEWLMETGRGVQEKEWESIRRGWCLGGEEFRAVMLEKLGRVLERKDRHSYSGAALDSHGEMMARKLLAAGLEALGLLAEDLSRTRKSDGRKQLLAWLVRRQTTMRNKWISQELQMGHEINVSRAVSRVARGEDKELMRLKKRVEVAIKGVD